MATDQPSQDEIEAVARALEAEIAQPKYTTLDTVPGRDAAYAALKGLARAAIAELDRLRSAPTSAWRFDMENAPKGKRFLTGIHYVYRAHGTGPAEDRFDVDLIALDENYDPPQIDSDFDSGWDWEAYTCWQPLPAPPPSTSDAGHRQVRSEKESGS